VISAEEFPAFVERRFGGKLKAGKHSPDGAACLHEAVNVAMGREWSDSTDSLGLDLRGLNDAAWSSDDARAAALLPVAVALWDFRGWPDERKRAWARRVAQETIRRIVPVALLAAAKVHPNTAHAEALTAAAAKCADEGTESAAWAAARSAESAESARSAAWAAWAAARSAESAESARSAAWAAAWSAESAWSARSAAADEPLRLIAAIFTEA